MTNKYRPIKQLFHSQPTLEGAGVHLKRAFGSRQLPIFDPFLLLDDFHSNEPEKYLPGFPWHPHRGIETITYMLEGQVAHGDSLGNEGTIEAGDVQWMTAGSGIIHQEMPRGQADGSLWGFQLWANLPARHKMMSPRYRGITAQEIPVISLDNGITIRLICGTFERTSGPVTDIMIDPEYMDVSVPAGVSFTHPTKPGYTVFAYVLEGQGWFEADRDRLLAAQTVALYGEGGAVSITASSTGLRFLLVSGQPLNEPVAWGGPIVMNTQEELTLAFSEYRRGTFLKVGRNK
jgi:redox-sensitive bicupin YhaK (pirin superfamily)